MIKIKGQQIERVEVEISECDLWDHFLDMLRKKAGLHESRDYQKYVKAGQLYEWCDGHGSGTTQKIGPATPFQIEVSSVLERLSLIRLKDTND